jgi:hypothetical protein
MHRRLRSSGDATFALIVDPDRCDRMKPVLQLTDVHGQRFVVELCAAEIRDLRGDADKMLSADAEKVSAWWAKLGSRASLPQAAIPQ